MQGKAPKTTVETKLVFPIDARIPDEYVPDLPLRMELYQRMGGGLPDGGAQEDFRRNARSLMDELQTPCFGSITCSE